jgi:hypothetical protein
MLALIRNDDEVHFVLDQHPQLDFYSASSLKQQYAGIHSRAPHIGVMVSVLASIVVDHGFEPQSSQTKDKNKVFVASPLSTQHKEKKQRLVGSESG